MKKHEPKSLRIFDNGGETADRYTVIIGADVFAFSWNPFSPNGVNMYCGRIGEDCDLARIARSGHAVSLSSVPPQIEAAIVDRWEQIWEQGDD